MPFIILHAMHVYLSHVYYWYVIFFTILSVYVSLLLYAIVYAFYQLALQEY